MSELQDRLQAAVGDALRIERELGGGGMSCVFLATELSLQRSVVIKVLTPELTSEVTAARFKREFEVTAVLGQHPHILPVLFTGTNGGLLYFVTPFIEGESLRHRIGRDGQLPIDDTVRILSELASALSYAHERGIVHRDLKPENVLLSDGHAVLADFGISAVLLGSGRATPGGPRDAATSRLTEMGMAVGTPGYMSPEQASGETNLDGRADIYALGVIGYELLTGSPPFTGPTPMAVMTAHLTEKPRPIDSLRDDTPPQLAMAIRRALAKKPADRFQTADEFRRALGVSYSGSTGIFQRLVRRSRVLVVAAAIVIAIVGAIALRAGRTEAVLDDNLVAVAPFETLGGDLRVWGEGMVDVLSSNLDGAGPLRSVPPSIVVRRAPRRMDRTSAVDFGRNTHAGITVFGRLVAAGDSVQAMATIVETATGRSTDIPYRDAIGRMDRVADSLSILILRELNLTRAIGATRRSAIGSASLPAMKAFLQGEQFYRRSDWDSAAAHYGRAVALDSNFAPALRHLSNALGWKLSPQYEVTHDGYTLALMAGNRNVGLAPRESLLVAADSIFAALILADRSVPAAQRELLTDRLTSMLENGARRFPDDPEIWYKLGDARYHFARFFFPSRTNLHSARLAFERSIALDSAFAPAYIHEVELAAADQDIATLRRATHAFLALDPQDVHGQSMRLISTMIDPRPHDIVPMDSVLRAGSADVVQNIYSTMVPLMDSSETQVAITRSLLDASRNGTLHGPLANIAHTVAVRSLLMRGHLAQALALTDSTTFWVYQELALVRAPVPPATDSLFNAWLHDERAGARRGTGILAWIRQGDTTRVAELLRAAEQRKVPYPSAFIRGLLALAARDTARAISLLTFPDSACRGWCTQARFPLALLLSARRRDSEAAAILDQDYSGGALTQVLWMLERGRVNERLGNRPKAVDAFAYVASAWRNPDATLTPYVDEARRALQRLNADPGRT